MCDCGKGISPRWGLRVFQRACGGWPGLDQREAPAGRRARWRVAGFRTVAYLVLSTRYNVPTACSMDPPPHAPPSSSHHNALLVGAVSLERLTYGGLLFHGGQGPRPLAAIDH